MLAESGAIVDYIIAKYGNGRLTLKPDHPDFADFLYWFHFANGTLQANYGAPDDPEPAEAGPGQSDAGGDQGARRPRLRSASMRGRARRNISPAATSPPPTS